VDAIAARLPRDRDEGRAVEVGVGDAGREVRRAGSERREADTRATGQAPVGVGHEGGPLLVPRRDEGDSRVQEGVQDVQDFLARQAEHVANLLVLETLDDQVGRFHTIASSGVRATRSRRT
jgi:hypothetical protein